MKKIFVVAFLALAATFVPLHAQTSPVDPRHNSAVVVSVKKHMLPADFIGGVIDNSVPQPQKYVYDVEVRLGCSLFVGRYDSNANQVPSALDLSNVVDVRMNNGLMTLTSPQGGPAVTTVLVSDKPASGCKAGE